MQHPTTRLFRKSLFLLLFLCLSAAPRLFGQAFQTRQQMITAANRFIATLNPELKSKALLPFSSPDRTKWDNEPSYLVKRVGITIGELNDEQRKALEELVRTALSPEGYLKAMNTIRLDDYLHAEGVAKKEKTADSYSSGHYWIVFFGTPSDTGRWSWRFEGHHLSLNFTLSNGVISVTPLFLGVNPALIPSGNYAGFRYMAAETDDAWALINILNKDQLSKATVSDELPPGKDILTRTGKEPHVKDIRGLSYSDMNDTQQKLFLHLMVDYVSNLNAELAKTEWEKLNKTRWDNFHFVLRGNISPGYPIYYAIQAPGFIIEFINRSGDLTHIHSVMRDLTDDFGEDFTKE